MNFKDRLWASGHAEVALCFLFACLALHYNRFCSPFSRLCFQCMALLKHLLVFSGTLSYTIKFTAELSARHEMPLK